MYFISVEQIIAYLTLRGNQPGHLEEVYQLEGQKILGDSNKNRMVSEAITKHGNRPLSCKIVLLLLKITDFNDSYLKRLVEMLQ